MITAILLAAGQSKRLVNQNKLIKNYKRKPLINHVVQSIIKSKIEKLIIVLGFEYLKVKKKVNKNKKIQFVINHNYKKGISSSIKCGLKKISNKNYGFIIVQADMPKISKNIFNKLHTEIKTNIRELIGALNRIVSYSRVYNKTASIPEVKIILKDLLNLSENKVTIDLIQSTVCRFFKISKNEMLSARRSRYLVRPRQTAIYLTKILTSKSLPEIGREFSNRDHTTIIHSVKTIEKLSKEDDELRGNIGKLKNQILYNNQNEV